MNPGVPPDLEAIILKCLAKSPDHRYATGDDLRIDLLRFREGRAVGATSPPTGQHPSVGADPGRHGRSAPRRCPPSGATSTTAPRSPAAPGSTRPSWPCSWWRWPWSSSSSGNSVGWWHIGEKAEHGLRHARRDQPERDDRPSGPCSTRASRRRCRPTRRPRSTPNTQVLRTVPAKGTTVKKGDRVDLVTGAQGPPVHVPDLVNQSVTAAKAQLQQMGLQANVQFSSTCTQQNIVCMQSPKSGQTILPGGTVSIFTQSTTTAGPRRHRARPDHGVQPPGPGRVPVRDDHDPAVAVGGQERRHQHQPGGRCPGAGQRQREPGGLERAVVGPRPLRRRRHPGPGGLDVAERGAQPGRDLPVRPCDRPRTGSCRPRPPTAGSR